MENNLDMGLGKWAVNDL